MIRRTAALPGVLRAVLVTVIGLCVLAATTPLAAQSPSDTGSSDATDVVAIASVSPWVTPEGEFQVRFEPSTRVPVDAQLTITVHEPLEAPDDERLRVAVQDVIDGGSSGRVLQTPVTVPFDQLGDPAAGATLTIPIRPGRGDRARVLVPNAGIHPVDLVLTSADGPELWSRTVFLNRLPEPEEPSADEPASDDPDPVRVTLVLPIGSAPAVGSDGQGSFTLEERTQLTSAAALLEAVPDAPLTLAVRPNTLDGLVRSDEPWATDLLAGLRAGRSEDVVTQLPYARVDTGSLVASGTSGELERQIVVGAGTVADRLSRRPDATTWVGDESLTDAVVPLLASTGVRALLAPLETFDLDRTDPDAAEPGGGENGGEDGAEPTVDEDQLITSPVPVAGGDGVQALAYDSVVSQRLADPATEPAVRAHQGVALMMAGWFESVGDPDAPPLASAVLLTPTTDPAVLASLSATLTSGGPLLADAQAGPLPDVAATDRDDTAGPAQVALAPRTTTDLRAAVAATNETRRQISAYRSMTGDADPDTELWDELTNESMSSSLAAGERAQLHAEVRGDIADKVALIDAPRARRVVVTSDEQSIPLRFRNGLPYEVRLVMRARSPRLEIDEPTTEIVLQPGETVIDLPVTVQAPGESLLRIELTSPDGGISIPGPAVPVRSTAISGVGAALSIVSILFLCLWWLRTMRRHRRQRAREQGSHPSVDAPAEPVPADRLGEGG